MAAKDGNKLLCWMLLLSGVSALSYEVIWVHELLRVFGNTVQSVAMVTGIFVAGLGLGAYGCGALGLLRGPTNLPKLWRLYSGCELGIALGGIAVLISQKTWLQALPVMFTRYQETSSGMFEVSGLSQAAHCVLIAVLLLPSTCFMGATLPLVLRIAAARGSDSARWKFGLLYAVNTAGGMAGCLLVDFLWIPHWGMRNTQIFAIGLNLALACLAWQQSRRATGAALDGGEDEAAPSAATPSTESSGLSLAAIGRAVLVMGACAMGLQVVWARLLVTALGGTRGVFAVLLGVILGGIWAGSAASGWFLKRWQPSWRAGGIAQMMMLLSAAVGLLWYDRSLLLTGAFAQWFERLQPKGLGVLAELLFILRCVVPVAGPAAFWSGFGFPVLVALMRNPATDPAMTAAKAYLLNCLGALLGSTITGFWLLPTIGMQGSVLVIALLAVLSTATLDYGVWRRMGGTNRRAFLSTGMGVALLAGWALLPPQYLVLKMFDPPRSQSGFLALSEGLGETVAVDEDPQTKARYLLTNGHSMSGTSIGSVRYMRMFSHIPLLQVENPKRVLVMCFGVGNTLHAASLHPSVESLELVDVSKHILEQGDFFSEWNHQVLNDPRLRIFINDGRHHLQMRPTGHYDLITLEPPPLAHAGVASLYTREFYQLARSRLASGGFLTQWLPALQVPEPVLRSAVRAFVDVFPNAVLLHGHGTDFVLVGRAQSSNQFDLPKVRARLAALPGVQADLEEVFLGSMLEILGSFVASAGQLHAFGESALPLTDDLPSMEYSYASFLESRIPKDLSAAAGFVDWCPTASNDNSGNLGELPTYLAIMENYYDTIPPLSFLKVRPPQVLTLDFSDPKILRTIRSSQYLQGVHGRELPPKS